MIEPPAPNRDGRTKGRRAATLALVFAALGVAIFVILGTSRKARPKGTQEVRIAERMSVNPVPLGRDARPLTSAIVGRVRGNDRAPVRAMVMVSSLNSEEVGADSSRGLAPHVTGEDGKFEFVDLWPGSYAVTATARGFAAAYKGPMDLAPGASATVDLVLGSGGAVLSGTVLDAAGGPIPEAILAAEWKRFELGTDVSPRVFPFQCDSAGKFEVHLHAGHYRVMVTADGYAQAEYWVDLTTSLQRDFTLERAGSISGRVLARRDGSLVAGATVELLITGTYRVRPGGGDERAPAQVAHVLGDADARFRFTGVSAGNYVLVARKGKWAGQRTEVVTVEPGGRVADADVRVSEGLRFAGRVVTSARIPVPRARVSLTAWGLNPHLTLVSDTRDDGTFSLEGLFPGVYRLDVRAIGLASAEREISLASDSVGQEIELPANTIIEGRLLTSTGRPVPNASVTVWNSPVPGPSGKERSTRMVLGGADGTFIVEGLTPGYFWLEAADGDGIAALGPEPLAAGEKRRVELRFGEGAAISGIVRWKGEGPAKDVLVRCKGSFMDRSARTDDAGSYRCDGLIEDGYAVVAVRNFAEEPWYLGAATGTADRDIGRCVYGGRCVWLASGQRVEGVDLELSRDDQSISGWVFESDGAPAGNVLVSASLESALGVSSRALNLRAVDGRATTLDDGSFQIDHLASGIYQVSAQSIRGEARRDNVPSGGNVRLRLQRTAVLRGVLVDREGRPVRSFTIHAYATAAGGESYVDAVARTEITAIAVQSVLDEEGRFEIAGLRAGGYEVTASTADGRNGRAAAVLREGENRSERIVLEEGSILRGRVVDYDTAQPVPNCQLAFQLAGREINTVTLGDGSFEITGVAEGQTLRLVLSAPGYINDLHTAQKKSSAEEEDLGVIKLIRARRWPPQSEARMARFSELVLEGKVLYTAVAGVRPGSQAEKKGIVPGAVVVRVGGKDAHHLGPISIWFLGSEPGPLAWDLQLPDGSIRTFDL